LPAKESPDPGIGVCARHGGATSAHKKHAVALEAKRRMVKLGQPLDALHPGEALLGLLRASAGHVTWIAKEVQELDDLGTQEAAVLLRLYSEERDRLARIDEACVRAGLKAEEIRLKQEQASLLATMVHAAAKEAGLGDKHVRALGAALRKLAAAQTEGENAADAVAQAEAHLAKLREEIRAEEERRIEREAQRYSGLTFPPEELVPAE
jgi:hypothetical protein